MAEICSIKCKNKTDAIIDAEYGRNFTMLYNKDIKAGGFLGIEMKREHELRRMLCNGNVIEVLLCNDNKPHTLMDNTLKCIKKYK
ncbi:GTP-binding protein [Brachyspira hampsonii]|uniref:GTP-binding protein n=1 Tax=Brachyspira hampsonii TaxID=1287055 RepID=UPI000D379FF3|nr:GTP-binding protein [Brachyspira hampsonii]PTY40580.1 GTP-binding protein [Brachyspira hampsonii bv. II]